jgi:ketosteroid isomerase-like protein
MPLGTLAAAILVASLQTATPSDTVAKLLEKQTQELFDALSSGNAAVWERYLDPACIFVDESGTVLTRKALVDDVRPFPEGISGTLRVTQFQSALHGDVAVATYVNDETEIFHGQRLRCQYRSTDTWKKTQEGWRLIAGQVLALRTDPPSIALSDTLAREYAGVYRLTPEIAYEIRVKNGALEGQQVGRDATPLLLEAPDVLFVPGRTRYRYVIQRGPDGKVTGFAQRREAWDVVWTRSAPAAAP